jgi:hypothetical protein
MASYDDEAGYEPGEPFLDEDAPEDRLEEDLLSETSLDDEEIAGDY